MSPGDTAGVATTEAAGSTSTSGAMTGATTTAVTDDTRGATMSTTEPDPTDPETTAADTGSTSGEDLQPVGCSGGVQDLTATGVVMASTEFSEEFPAALGVDGSRNTSWFSSGPGDDDTSLYTWTLPETRCLSTLELAGNGMHTETSFQENFGFADVMVRVFDSDATLVFEEMHDLPGTPDPQITVDFGDIEGASVELEFRGHEDPSCGGFSELAVLGA